MAEQQMNDDYIRGRVGTYFPYWLLRVLRTAINPEFAKKKLRKQYFTIEGEMLLFAKSIDKTRGVICSTMCRVIYFKKELRGGMPVYEETMHNFVATPTLIKRLLSMDANADYNATIRLCMNVAIEVNLPRLSEKIKQMEDHLEQLIALKQVEINELIRERCELMVCAAKISAVAKK